MKVRDILAEKGTGVFTIPPEASITQAVAKLNQHHIGGLIVVDGDKPVGVITERDVVRRLPDKGADFDRVAVGELMTSDVIVGLLDDDVAYVEAVMTNNRFRHLPILVDGKLAGIVSIGDVMKARVAELKVESHHLLRYIADPYPG